MAFWIDLCRFYVEEAGDKEELPPEIVEMLNGDSKPILITAGTSKMIRPEFYEVASEACRILGKTGILVTLYDELVPKPLPDNVKRFQKLSIRSLLPHVDALFTMEALERRVKQQRQAFLN